MKRDPLGRLNDWLDKRLGAGVLWVGERFLAIMLLSLAAVTVLIVARWLA